MKVLTAAVLAAATLFGGAAPAVAYEYDLRLIAAEMRCSDPNACLCVDQTVAGVHVRKCTL